MRLIDADRLKADFIGNRYGTQAIEYVIDQQPTVDAEPVRHGRWTKAIEQPFIRKHYHKVCCSECHREGIERWKYCPYCGAKMDEVET